MITLTGRKLQKLNMLNFSQILNNFVRFGHGCFHHKIKPFERKAFLFSIICIQLTYKHPSKQ